MKTLQWFKVGDSIPKNAVYIKSERKVVSSYEDWGPMGNDTIYVYDEFYLYEVPTAPSNENCMSCNNYDNEPCGKHDE